MVRSKVNDTYDYLIEKIKDQFTVNGEKKNLDIQRIDETNYHIIHNNKSFKVSILHYDIQTKKFEIKVNEHTYKVELQDENDLLLEKIGIQKDSIKKDDGLIAPMPGLIIDIRVKEGQTVKGGDPLIVLKAMKMENVLISPHDGIIKKILVEKNQKINKDELILQF
jgi:acetyl/propionyl-CoA carboxylase alpha subunit